MSLLLLAFSFDSHAQTVNICGRTDQVEAAILAKLPSGTACATVTSAQLAGILTLRIQNISGSVSAGDFSGLTSLDGLYIDFNSLTSLPENLFDGLTKLEELSLTNNSLGSLPEDLFDGLTALRALYLTSNSLTILPEDLFDGLTSLGSLNLSNNSLGSLEEDLFDGLTKLEELSLTSNSLGSLEEDLFDGLTKLEELSLTSNSLGSLEEDLFDGLTNLEQLDLSGNSPTNLEEDLFDGLTNLERLDLSDNSLTILPEDLFDGLTNLERLDLSDNSLTILPEDLFDHVTGLLLIDLRGNDIPCFPSTIVDETLISITHDNKNVKCVNICERTSAIQTAIFDALESDVSDCATLLPAHLPSIVRLNANNKSIESLSAGDFNGLTNLDSLYLNDNSLTGLPEDLFDGLTSLELLNLNDNSLTSLEEDLFDGLTGLRNLWLGSNGLVTLDEDLFDGLTDLNALNLKSNSLTSLHEDLFDGLDGLRVLNISTNDLATLHEDLFGGLTKLLRLYLHENDLSNLPEDLFNGLTSLKQLGLGTNRLTSLDEDLFDGLTGLEDLNLRDNSLESLEEDLFDGLTNLEILTLSSNNLTYLPESLFDHVTRPQSLQVYLSGNDDIWCFPASIVDNTAITLGHTRKNRKCVIGTVTLSIFPTSIRESGGSTRVLAQQDQVSNGITTVEISTSHASPVEDSDYTLSDNTTLTIAAGRCCSRGTVTITAADNDEDAPDKTVDVQGVASNPHGIMGPEDVTLIIADDDDPVPVITLALSSSSISENGGSTIVTASLDQVSTAVTTVEVSTSHASPVEDSDYTLSDNTTLTIAAGQTTSTGTVTITAENNDTDAPDKTVTVQGAATDTQGITGPANVTFMITDDDDAPTVTLSLEPESISEKGGSTTVTASLDHPSSEITTIEVSTSHTSPVADSDYTLSSNTTLTIAAGSTTSTGEVKITAVDNDANAPDKTITVQGAATNTQGITDPANVTFMITDDDEAATVTLSLSQTSISENGGSATVTASLDQVSGAVTTVEISASHAPPVANSDYTLSPTTTLTIAAGQTTSSGTVTITAENNDTDAPDKTVTVQGAATNTEGVSGPEAVTLMITDEDDAPTVTLSLSSVSIGENGGSTTVTASLDHPSSEVTTVEISTSHTSPVADSDYTLSSNTTLTIAAGSTTSTGEVTITAEDNDTDEPDKTVTVQGVASNTQGVTDPANEMLMITDDDEAATVTLSLSQSSISESGGSTTVTASLDQASVAVTTVEISASHASPVADSDYTLSPTTTLTIAAGQTTSSGTVTITAVDNDTDAPDKTITVQGAASNTQGITGPEAVTLMITDEDDAPTVMLSLSSVSISENGGSTTVTASLDHPSSEVTTVEISASHAPAVADSDYALSPTTTLTIAAGQTASTGTVTITAEDNDTDAPDKAVTVQGAAANTQGITGPANLTLMITDEDGPPTVRLVLSPTSISENGGRTTVTASLDRPSSAVTTVEISASHASPVLESDYVLSENTTLTIAAGQTSSTGTVTIIAEDNNEVAADKTVVIQGVASNTQGANHPVNVELTITDNDTTTPTARLVLSPISISERGGRTTVTATLNPASNVATTITVSATPHTGASISDYSLSDNTTLTIAAGQTTSTGTVTITAEDNDTDAPDKTVTVQGTLSTTQGITGPEDVSLTITDEDDAPTVTLSLSSTSISENGGSTTVTASLDRPSSEVTMVEVSATHASPVADADYALSNNTTLTIAAGQTSSTGEVTITAVDNDVDAPNKTVMIQGVAVNSQGVTDPTGVPLTITDEDDALIVTLSLSTVSIRENGGSTTVTASLSRPSGLVTSVTVLAAPQSGALSSDYALSPNPTLTIAAGQTTSTGTVTITAVDNDVDAPDKTVAVQGIVNAQGIANSASVILTITDEDDAPTAVLLLSPASIGENGESTTVTASLDRPSSEVTTVTVTAIPRTGTSVTDYTLSNNTTLTILAGQTSSTGAVTVTAVDNAVDTPDKTVTIQGTAVNVQGISGPADVDLTIINDDVIITVTLLLSPASISENGGSTTVTASLDRPSSVVTTVGVTATPQTGTLESDYALSTNTTLTIAAGQTTSSGTVTVTALDNDVDAPNKMVTVSGAAVNVQGVAGPADVVLTINDDEGAPTVTYSLSPASISENGGSTTVTANLDRPSVAITTVTVRAVPQVPAITADYLLSQNTTLTIAAGQTTSTGEVTITAIDNDVDAPDKTVTIMGVVANTQGITDPENVTLTITDEDEAPTVTLSLSPILISENAESATITATLDHASSELTTVTVSATPQAPTLRSDYMMSQNTTLTIAAGDTTSTGDVTLTTVDNDVDGPDKRVTVRGTAVNAQGILGPTDVVLTVTDDEGEPTVTLLLSPMSISESGGHSTVTSILDQPSSVVTTITVTAMPQMPATSADYMFSQNTTLTITAGETTSTGEVTITAVDNSEEEPDKMITVQGTAVNTQGINAPADVSLTITDDDSSLRFTEKIEDQNYPRGQMIPPLVLPEANGGLAPIRYMLTPTLPEGLHFDSSTRMLNGTPTVVTGSPVEYTYTATDASGLTSSLQFKIRVYSPVSVETEAMPEVFTVVGNYPNPFWEVTEVMFDLPWAAQVRAEVMDVIGRRVLTIPETNIEAGWAKTIRIDGGSLSPGIYLYRLITVSSSGNSLQMGRFVRVR